MWAHPCLGPLRWRPAGVNTHSRQQVIYSTMPFSFHLSGHMTMIPSSPDMLKLKREFIARMLNLPQTVDKGFLINRREN